MKKAHSGRMVGFAVFFLAAIYSACVFLLKSHLDFAAWLLYGFTITAFLCVLGQILFANDKKTSPALHATVINITLVYWAIQFLFGGIICMCFDGLSATAVAVCEIILIAVYLAVVFVFIGAKSHANAQDSADHAMVRKNKLWEMEILNLADAQTCTELKDALKSLAEEFHYSDVATHPELADVEDQIAECIALLKDDVNVNSADTCNRVDTLKRLIAERNRKIMLLKH